MFQNGRQKQVGKRGTAIRAAERGEFEEGSKSDVRGKK